MAQANRLKWVENPDGWLVEIHEPVHGPDKYSNYAGAKYQIREHGSPAVFELRWMWVPMFDYGSPADRKESLQRYKEFHWSNEYLVRDFGSLDEAMGFAEEQEKHRLKPTNANKPPALENLRLWFQSDTDGVRYVCVDGESIDMAGWKIETIDQDIGTRDIQDFDRNFMFTGAKPWSAICDWGNLIVRWIPPGEDI